ncbi:hypothetical protein Adeg_0695 [Ammonifex degensii KC4]|uniref:Uncharacterized protein n=1 Tax=Ammonifex degensii (strain DSM 10501 / KC4) TaxID=429009 RepID=C9RC65_AMMDK|nr:hypothetical protein [Ammonifex degensii]ACX51842.1 hypothetical protein Adeg_0695 [Ammonifex degensii KC4]
MTWDTAINRVLFYTRYTSIVEEALNLLTDSLKDYARNTGLTLLELPADAGVLEELDQGEPFPDDPAFYEWSRGVRGRYVLFFGPEVFRDWELALKLRGAWVRARKREWPAFGLCVLPVDEEAAHTFWAWAGSRVLLLPAGSQKQCIDYIFCQANPLITNLP